MWGRRHKKRGNPDVLGVDIWDAIEVAFGAGAASLGNDKFVSPLAQKLAGPLYKNPVLGKFADAFTTGITGWGISKGLGMFSRHLERQVVFGTVMISAMKVITAFVPGWYLNAGLPTSFQLNNPFASGNGNGNAGNGAANGQSNAAAGKGTNAANGKTPAGLPAPSGTGADAYFTSYPRPVAASQYVGL